MNQENLVPFNKMTEEQQREIARKGGIASQKKQKERKKLKEDLLIALGIVKGDKTIQEIGVEAILDKFMSGDIQAFTTIRDTIGEKPRDEVKNVITYEDTLKKVSDPDEY